MCHSSHVSDADVPAGYAGVLHDVEATDKSIAAGGKDSVKNEYGVSDPYATGARKAINTKELMQKLQKIQSISLKVLLSPPDLSLQR
jgi:hypothetical protein